MEKTEAKDARLTLRGGVSELSAEDVGSEGKGRRKDIFDTPTDKSRGILLST